MSDEFSSFVEQAASDRVEPQEYRHGCWVYLGNRIALLDFDSQNSGGTLGHRNARLEASMVEASSIFDELGEGAISHVYDRLSEDLCRTTFADHTILCPNVASARKVAIEAALEMLHEKDEYADGHVIRFSSSLRAYGKRLGRSIPDLADPSIGYPPKLRYIAGRMDLLEASINQHTAAIMVDCFDCGYGNARLTAGQIWELRDLCDFYRINLIFDEGRIGVGRTGCVFAYEPTRVIPDVLVTGKEMAGSSKIGVCLVRQKSPHTLRTRTRHLKVTSLEFLSAMTSAATTMAMLNEQRFMSHVRSMSRRLTARVNKLADTYPDIVHRVHCTGLRAEIDCPARGSYLRQIMRDEGVIVGIPRDQKIVLTPPLVINATEIDEGCERIGRALDRVRERRSRCRLASIE
ncbi:acetylornithine transaminase protein [Paraburkholderia hospita]|uniref:Acetylornithine transaminase protein n=1 Tax=Paraburkholderia hospita TaxID=169430 RepID=A0ABP2Q138_9BURK|nr:aminotransferase class III-fold pyridoxal phosphate-dependent enzyme [Paraburkholderia hospita]EIN02212.1 acetylornithine transaminase protein [Paraburkholderia hospita]OUL90102.1 hypothetical protein CA602_07395 [Paraburkholderia hospita]